ncbi:Hormonally upregulated Neu-associated kinase [Trichophyton interdigitale]|nr:Hormonally upregulated Neu-associated kinase [Trichophyton interdigitale]KAG5218721.1 Hormonally upregulated Neu-associated kinase [Trichophyton interdigitale]KAG8208783.1 Hormonally upregulated Neu-associated kinase [Trichophyton interdigitale]
MMAFHYADALHKHNWLGGGGAAYVYHVSPTIAVKTVRLDLSDREKESFEEHQLTKDIAFYRLLNERQDRCPHIVECFLILPDHLFLSFCSNGAIGRRYYERQERENDHLFGRLLGVKGYEHLALVARWVQQLTSALEYVEKLGYCHNDLRPGNCLLDARLNLKLTDFGCATTIGQYLECTGAPWAARLSGGPLQGTFGLCSARTEQFALGSMVYFLVYGHEPHEEKNLEGPELIRRFDKMELPELNRHEVFDGLIWGCWYNVYPTMALAAYDFKRKTKDIIITSVSVLGRKEDEPEAMTINDRTKETRICEGLVRKGILGAELAFRFQPLWWRYLHATRSRFISHWRFLMGLLGNIRRWLPL